MSLGRFPGESAFSTPERVLSRREKLERMEQLLASPDVTPRQRAAVKVIYDASKRRLDATTVGVLGQPQGIDLTQVRTPPGAPPGYLQPVTTEQFEETRRNLSGYLNRVGDPITTGHSDTTLPAIDASSILDTGNCRYTTAIEYLRTRRDPRCNTRRSQCRRAGRQRRANERRRRAWRGARCYG